jgi:hypothetical protein
MLMGLLILQILTLCCADSWPLAIAPSSLSDLLTVGSHSRFVPFVRVSGFAIPKCKDFVSMESLICRSPTIFGSLTRVPNGWTISIKNSDFTKCQTKDTYLCEFRWCLISATLPLQMENLDHPSGFRDY